MSSTDRSHNWRVVITQSVQTSVDTVVGEISTAAVGAGGDWSHSIAAKNGFGTSNDVTASCTDNQGDRLDYVAQSFTTTTAGAGYWLLTNGTVLGWSQIPTQTNVREFGDAPHLFESALPFAAPLVGIAPNPTSGDGYWLVASDGGIFSFGDAKFFGSTGSLTLNKPVVGMAATPDGKGYWLVASDGGIFSFGDANSSGAREA